MQNQKQAGAASRALKKLYSLQSLLAEINEKAIVLGSVEISEFGVNIDCTNGAFEISNCVRGMMKHVQKQIDPKFQSVIDVNI